MSEPETKDPLSTFVDRLGAEDSLDALESLYDRAASTLPPDVAAALRGEQFEHPLHPMLTDLPIGFWTSAMVLDVVGGRRGAPMARRLVGLGVLSAVPTALTGLAEFSVIEDPAERRVAAVHGAGGGASTLLFALSWRLRRKHRILGILVGWVAGGAATATGVLGGHLAFGPDIEEPIDAAGAPGLTSEVTDTDFGEVIG